MEYIQEITLDLNSNTAPPIIYTKQGDVDTRVLEIHLMENGNEYQPPAGANAVFRMRKPDGTVVADYVIASVGSNIVTVRLSEQTLTAAGRGLADILLYDENSQYLSTASFILVIQSAPVEVMQDRAMSTNEYAYFSQCLQALPTYLSGVQAAASRAESAANRAESAATSGFVITPSSVLPSGKIEGIFIRDEEAENPNTFQYNTPVPHFHPTANVLISGDTALFDVNVSSWSGAIPESEVSGLQVALDFNLTIPEYDVDIALDTELVASDKAAQAQAVGSRFNNLSISSIGISPASPLSIGNGGTSASDAESARANIGAQQIIQVHSSGSLASGAAWAYDTANAIYSQALYVPLNGINLDRVPEFVASPKDIESWNEAADIGMGPPTAAAPTVTGATDWPLTFQAESSSTKNINITVYWW